MAAAALLVSAAGLHCTEEIQIGRNFSGGGAGSGAGAASGSSGVGGADLFPVLDAAVGDRDATVAADSGPCLPTPCRTERACGDCDDNDMDSRIDAADPECLGPCDESESVLASGTPVQITGTCATDCFFDRNAGTGNDCSWSFRCDPEAVAPNFPPTGSDRCAYDSNLATCQPGPAEIEQCRSACLPLTPNGCDCFGCCELPAHSGRFTWIGADSVADGRCDLNDAQDPDCPICTQAETCKNDCDECELCVLKNELPAACGGSVVSNCATGRACDPRSGVGCNPIEYCITGCCVPLPR